MRQATRGSGNSLAFVRIRDGARVLRHFAKLLLDCIVDRDRSVTMAPHKGILCRGVPHPIKRLLEEGIGHHGSMNGTRDECLSSRVVHWPSSAVDRTAH